MTRNRFARAAVALLVLGACGPGPRADADRVWRSDQPRQAAGTWVAAIDGESGAPSIALGAPYQQDPYTESGTDRGVVYLVTADTESGLLKEVAPTALRASSEFWGDEGFFSPDLDGEGGPDLFVAGSSDEVDDSYAVLLEPTLGGAVGDAWGTLVGPVPERSLGRAHPCGDLDGDGTADLCFDGEPGQPPSVARGPLGHGALEESVADLEVRLPLGQYPVWSAGSDLDGDGDDDATLCVALPDQCWWVADLGAPLEDAPVYRGRGGTAVPLADLDGDGLGDLLYGGLLFVGKEGGGPDDAWWVLDAEDSQVVAAATGDFDGDGHPDLAVGVGHDSDLKTRIYLGPLPNRTSTEEDVALTVPGGSLAAADVDGDGADDLVVGLPTANDGAGQVQLFFGRRMFPR